MPRLAENNTVAEEALRFFCSRMNSVIGFRSIVMISPTSMSPHNAIVGLMFV